MKKEKLIILVLGDKEIWDKVKAVVPAWERYFELEIIFDVPTTIDKYTNKGVDILFMDGTKFKYSFYQDFQDNNKTFIFTALMSKPSDADISSLKNGADRISYYDLGERYFKWSTIAALRRYWNAYSKPTTIIHKGLICDFLDGKYTMNGKSVELTQKEESMLKLFINNIGKPLNKNTVFQTVWGFEEANDSTRTVDQMLFKLKKKIGKDFFTTIRGKGIVFE